jgi:hypothetical protein
MTDAKPLPCPFCGAKPGVVSDDSYGACSIFCTCDPEPSVQRERGELPQAIAAWNRRTAAPGVTEAIIKARELIGAKNDRLSPAAREANINAAWHVLTAALSSPKEGKEDA